MELELQLGFNESQRCECKSEQLEDFVFSNSQMRFTTRFTKAKELTGRQKPKSISLLVRSWIIGCGQWKSKSKRDSYVSDQFRAKTT